MAGCAPSPLRVTGHVEPVSGLFGTLAMSLSQVLPAGDPGADDWPGRNDVPRHCARLSDEVALE
jgi:hypothetical protein